MSEPIVLDKWDSQLVWLSKGWLKNPKDLQFEQLIKNLWSNRCGFYTEFVEIGYVASHTFSLLFKLGLFDDYDRMAGKLLSDLAPVSMFEVRKEPRYKDNAGFALYTIWVCLYNNLSTLQICEDGKDLIILQEFEPDFLLHGLEPEEPDYEEDDFNSGWYCPKSLDLECHYNTDGKDEKGYYVILRDKAKGERRQYIEDKDHDPRLENKDCCLFCGEPEERK